MNHTEEMFLGKTADISQEGCDGHQITSSSRRSFLGLLLGAGAAAVGALLSVPLFRFMLHPLLTATSSSSWKEVGSVEDLASVTSPVKKLVKIEQRDGWRKIVSEKALYVCKDATGRLCAFSSVCPHLGCSIAWRSEEHTSELQSQSNLVCRLLLEKKKITCCVTGKSSAGLRIQRFCIANGSSLPVAGSLPLTTPRRTVVILGVAPATPRASDRASP